MNEKEKTIRYIDLFAGVGGFRLGIERAFDISTCRKSKQNENTKDKSDSQRIESFRQHSSCNCVFTSEIDKYCMQTYNKNFGTNIEPNDITKQDADSIPDFDLLCAGFPCQAFSIAGKRRGFEDTRGTMFYEIARILKVKRPKYLLLENVKGLLSHDGGRTFAIILTTLSELGYDVQWMVLNSKFFGVPQNRERVFIIGSVRETSRPEILPFGEDDRKIDELQRQHTNTITQRYEKAQATGSYVVECEQQTQEISYAKQDKSQHSRVYNTDGIAPTLAGASKLSGDCTPKIVDMVEQIATKRSFETPKEINEFLKEHKGRLTINHISEELKLPKTQVEHYFRADKSRAVPSPDVWWKLKELLGFPSTYDREVTDIYTKEVEFEQTRRVYDGTKISPTINATGSPIISQINPSKESGGKQPYQQNRIYDKEGLSPALSSELGGDRSHLVNTNRIRRLTPIECERLQGFPDNWTAGVSDTQRYKQMGNAVTVDVVEAIIWGMFRW